jgi:hypothetical protein
MHLRIICIRHSAFKKAHQPVALYYSLYHVLLLIISYSIFHFITYCILEIVETLENEITGLLPKFAKALEEYLERQRDENNEKETC